MTQRLVVCATHPIQYIAPVLRHIQAHHDIEVTAIYGSDFSIAGYQDKEFGTTFRWDTDLLQGYTSHFLSRAAETNHVTPDRVQAPGIAAAFTQYRPDCILLTGYQGPFHQQAWQAALRTGTPLLLRAETTDHALRRSFVKTWLRDGILRWLYSRCAVLLPVGIHSTRHYQRLTPRKPRILAPYCVDTTAFQTSEEARAELRTPTRQELGLQDNQIAILFSGKLIPKKNPTLLVQAVKQLPATTRERIVLLFLGDGELRASVETLSETEPTVQTRFLGFKNQTALSPYYHAADVLVLPSAWGETWGLVVNEALHHGLPAIVSDQVGSAPDLVHNRNTGYMFPAGAGDALATALTKSISEFIGKPQVRAACREVVSHYTIADAATGIAQAVHQSGKR